MTRLSLLGTGALVLALTLVACGGDKAKPDSTSCTPTTCKAAVKNCGSMPDGCGGVIKCGDCTSPESCGGGGTANVCGQGIGCTPTTCVVQGKTCGTISDNCSDVLACGTCTAPQVCGGAGVPNVCGVRPDSGPTPDTGPKTDSSTSVCAATCMAQSGAVCCTGCGCDGTVKCLPVCDSPYKWDCEMRCCFNYTTYKCK